LILDFVFIVANSCG